MQLSMNTCNLLMEIQFNTLRILKVHEEDEQINIHFGPSKHLHDCQALVLQLKEVLCGEKRGQ